MERLPKNSGRGGAAPPKKTLRRYTQVRLPPFRPESDCFPRPRGVREYFMKPRGFVSSVCFS